MTDLGPSSLPRNPTASALSNANASSSASPTPNVCIICSDPSKYTCPRCSVKTCSLACSKSHKTSTGCTGERDRTVYVAMNTYTWGTLADDYVFLEDMGRNVTGWGREIAGTGRGRGGRKGGRGVLTPKCEALRVQLAARDMEISFLPEGMEKRRLSQSVWDVRTKTAYLTIEFVFHMEDPKQKDSSYETVSLLTHRNDLAVPLATSLASHLKRKSDIPASILSFMKISQDISRGAHSIRPGMLFTISQLERPNPSATPVQYQAPSLPIRITSLHTADSASSSQPSNSALKPRKVFYPIDPNSSLQNCLRNRSFVEWPTIDIFPSRQTFAEGRFGDLAEGTNMGPTTLLGEEGPNKRRKTETGLVQLIGGYGEESESEAEDPKPQGVEGLGISGLGDYASDEDEANGVDKG